MRKILTAVVSLLLYLFGSYALTYSIDLIDNSVNPLIPGDHILVKLLVTNNVSESVYVSPVTLSPCWDIRSFPDSKLLYPGESETFYIYGYLRPEDYCLNVNSFPIRLPDIGTILIPIKVVKTEIPKELEINITDINNYAIEPGAEITQKICVYNPNKVDITVRISMDSSAFSNPARVEGTVPRESRRCFTVSGIVRRNAAFGKYIVITYVNYLDVLKKYEYEISVVEPKDAVKILKRDYALMHVFEITNTKDVPLIYEYKLTIPSKHLAFWEFYPNPSELYFDNGNAVLIWRLLLEPGETFVIKQKINYLLIILVLIPIIIAVALIYVIETLSRRIFVEKFVSKDKETGLLQVTLNIKNRTGRKLKTVIVEEFVPKDLEVLNEFGFVKPISVLKDKNGTKIKWMISEMLPGEERIVTYKVKPAKKRKSDILLEPTKVSTKVFGKSVTVFSNTVWMKFRI